jgi:phosphinothricin acetyltransferase
MLYDALSEQLRAKGITQIYACIGVPEIDDEYLTNNSAEFHAHMGFREVGRFRNSGKKFGRFYHMIWMEKLI